MNIFIADDERLALDALTQVVKECAPTAIVHSFFKPFELLEFTKVNPCDVAFLDINMREITGIELAKRLKEINPKINIIFVTGYDEYIKNAMDMHVSGYILKPVSKKRVVEELSDLRHPIIPKNNCLLRIKCFGNFDVYTVDGKLVTFQRSKAKEVFAYLCYKSGSTCTVKEIAAILFEDNCHEKKKKDYLQKIVFSMMQTLKNYKVEEVITKKYNSLALDTTKVDCDYYRFLEYDTSAINSYCGEFMANYSWGEFAISYLEKLFWKNKKD